MNKEEFEQLSAEYALGSLRRKDREMFEEYLRAATPQELKALSEMLGTASLLPLTLDPQTPPDGTKEAVLQRIRLAARAHDTVAARTSARAPLTHRPTRSRMWAGIAVAALLVVVGLSIALLRMSHAVDQQNGRLAESRSMVSSLNVQLIALKDELSRKEEMLKILSSRKIEITFMNGLKVNPVGYGKIIWDPEKQTAILQVSRLPAVPRNKDYQLWVIKGKTPISAGVFSVADTASSFFRIDGLAVTDPHEISAFAVTLEPKGGVPAPTGDMYLAGSPKL